MTFSFTSTTVVAAWLSCLSRELTGNQLHRFAGVATQLAVKPRGWSLSKIMLFQFLLANFKFQLNFMQISYFYISNFAANSIEILLV